MNKFKSLLVTVISVVSFITVSAFASPQVEKKVQQHAYNGDVVSGISELEKLVAASPNDNAAKFGLGILQFLYAVEGLQQDLFRYGTGNQTFSNNLGFLRIPIFRVPVASNPDFQVATYEDSRRLLEHFNDRLILAEKTLSSVTGSPKITLDLLKIGIDGNADGLIQKNEKLIHILQVIDPRSRRHLKSAAENDGLVFQFDTADSKWLQGYTNVLLAISNFFLAFDYEKTYDATFHTVFGTEATEFGRKFSTVAADFEEIEETQKLIEKLDQEILAIFSKSQQKELRELQDERRKIRLDKELSKAEKEAKLRLTAERETVLKDQRTKTNDLKSQKSRLTRRLNHMKAESSFDSLREAELEKEIGELNSEIAAIFSEQDRRRLVKLNKQRKRILARTGISRDQKEAKIALIQPELDTLRGAIKRQKKLKSRKRELSRELSRSISERARRSSDVTRTFLDPINFLHTMSWKTVEPARLAEVRRNLLKMTNLNHQTWKLIRSETDDEREWLPSATQTNWNVSMKVTDEVIDSWLGVIDQLGQVLEGKMLVPSLRFSRGVNMKKFFDQAESFDLILFLTGPNSIDYLEKGPVWDQRLWRTLRRPFGRNFGAFALWFN